MNFRGRDDRVVTHSCVSGSAFLEQPIYKVNHSHFPERSGLVLSL